jgi:16S rRNA (adenine1518-N6/adenine1519-N6)-dimethyltransferase
MKINHKPKKSLGQNFLIDENIINKIAKVGNINNNKIILEIGAGYGSLTSALVKLNPKKIFAVEKDKKLALFLENNFKKYNNVEILNHDILDIIENNNLGKNITVFGNLPYNISTKILTMFTLINKWPPWYDNLILMFQKEVADRIIAKKNTKDFSRLSVLVNWKFEIRKHFNISNNCFYPKPKISSSLLTFNPKKNNQYKFKNPKNLEKITRILFSNRRKMINKNFLKIFNNNEALANKLNLKLNKRPGELDSEMFYKITKEYEKLLR